MTLKHFYLFFVEFSSSFYVFLIFAFLEVFLAHVRKKLVSISTSFCRFSAFKKCVKNKNEDVDQREVQKKKRVAEGSTKNK